MFRSKFVTLVFLLYQLVSGCYGSGEEEGLAGLVTPRMPPSARGSVTASAASLAPSAAPADLTPDAVLEITRRELSREPAVDDFTRRLLARDVGEDGELVHAIKTKTILADVSKLVSANTSKPGFEDQVKHRNITDSMIFMVMVNALRGKEPTAEDSVWAALRLAQVLLRNPHLPTTCSWLDYIETEAEGKPGKRRYLIGDDGEAGIIAPALRCIARKQNLRKLDDYDAIINVVRMFSGATDLFVARLFEDYMYRMCRGVSAGTFECPKIKPSLVCVLDEALTRSHRGGEGHGAAAAIMGLRGDLLAALRDIPDAVARRLLVLQQTKSDEPMDVRAKPAAAPKTYEELRLELENLQQRCEVLMEWKNRGWWYRVFHRAPDFRKQPVTERTALLPRAAQHAA